MDFQLEAKRSYRNGALCNTRKTLKNIELLPVSSFPSSNPIECLVTKLRTFDKHSSKDLWKNSVE